VRFLFFCVSHLVKLFLCKFCGVRMRTNCVLRNLASKILMIYLFYDVLCSKWKQQLKVNHLWIETFSVHPKLSCSSTTPGGLPVNGLETQGHLFIISQGNFFIQQCIKDFNQLYVMDFNKLDSCSLHIYYYS